MDTDEAYWKPFYDSAKDIEDDTDLRHDHD